MPLPSVNTRRVEDNQVASRLYSCEDRLYTTSWEDSGKLFPSRIDGTHSLRI